MHTTDPTPTNTAEAIADDLLAQVAKAVKQPNGDVGTATADYLTFLEAWQKRLDIDLMRAVPRPQPQTATEFFSRIENLTKPSAPAEVPPYVAQTKQWRRDIDARLQELKEDRTRRHNADWRNRVLMIRNQITEAIGESTGQRSRFIATERLMCATSEADSFTIEEYLTEAVMWLGMDLKAYNEAHPGTSPNPYPESKNPASDRIEPTADGLKL